MILPILFVVSLILIIGFNRHDPKESQKFHVYPVPETQNLNLGHKNSMADSFWLKFVQNDDFCESDDKEKAVNHGQGLDEILDYKMKPSRCHLGWTYQILNFITDLSPKFREAYLYGGTALAIGVDDRQGAKIIFEKALKQFPNDWVINYRASYVYLFELQQPGRAAELLMNAYKNGGPEFLAFLAARLFTKEGKATIGKAILEEFIKENPNSGAFEHAQKRLSEINKETQNH